MQCRLENVTTNNLGLVQLCTPRAEVVALKLTLKQCVLSTQEGREEGMVLVFVLLLVILDHCVMFS